MVAVENAVSISTKSPPSHPLKGGGEDIPEVSLNASDTAFVASNAGKELAEEFVAENGHRFHPIFKNLPPRTKPEPSSAHSYDGQRAEKHLATRSTQLKRSSALDVETTQFYRVIEAYKRTAKGDALPPDFDIRGSHSWEEVFYAARNAEAKSSHDGSKNILRRFGRGTQKHAMAISPWLDLIPNGDYTSALCGSLKIAFSVAHRMKEKRTAITETLGKIPKTITKAEDRLEEHPDDEALFDAATELYLAVLKVVEGMLKYLVDTSTWKKIGALLVLPEKPIDVGLSEVEAQMENLSNRAQTLLNRKINGIDDNLKDVQVKTEELKLSAEYTELHVSHLSPYVGMTYTTVNEMNARSKFQGKAFDGVANLCQELFRNLKANEKIYAANERLHAKHDAKMMREIRSLKKQCQASNSAFNITTNVDQATPPRTPSPELPFTQELLESLFNVDQKMIEQDLQKIIREGGRSPIKSQSRGHWLLQDAKFQNWLTAGETRGLLVDGNFDGNEKISAMSFVCALLIQSLKIAETAITISSFCGLHTRSNDPLSSASGLLRSLISQLLCIQDFNLSSITEEYEEQLHENNLAYLIDLFQLLVEQLPENRVLFCLVDGIAFYEKNKDKAEICAVLNTLAELANDQGVGPIVKLLVTNPLRSRWAGDFFPRADRLQVPANAGDGQMLSINQVMRHTNKSAVFHEHATSGVDGSTSYEPESESSEDEDDYELGNFGASDEQAP